MIRALKYAQYFAIAAITNALLAATAPSTNWEWWRLVGAAVLQGLIAMKALQSKPDEPPTNS